MPKGLSHGRIWELENGDCMTVVDHATAGGFLHFCADWDYLVIDQTDHEFESCSCAFNPEMVDPKTGKPRLDS